MCGTCGYDYPEWRNVFYPQGLPREEFLTYYAARFGALEVNYTYYRMPTEYQLRDMLKCSNGKILFSIKAPQLLTHTVSAAWTKDAECFRNALLPLKNAGVLSAVLFQFPQSFHYIPDNRIYLGKLLEAFPDLPSVVEFRHTDWYTDRVYEGLNRRKTGICICDMPQLKFLPKIIPVVTGNTGYIRFHGRNAQNWYGSSGVNGSDRYRYLYTEKELSDSVQTVRTIAAQSKIVHVFFNNHPEGGAAVNAVMMQDLLNDI